MINILIQEFAPKQTVADQNALEQFQKQWSTYQKLVDADALSHRAAGKLLHDALCAIPTTFAFVDIACGDASQMRKVLLGTKCRHYQGIDLSAPALELAAKNLASAPYEVELDHEDFVEALTKRPSPPMPPGAAFRSTICQRSKNAVYSNRSAGLRRASA